MKLLMFAASLSQGSLNKKLIKVAAREAMANNATVDLAEFSEFDLPLYNLDLQQAQGFPENMKNFVTRLQAADGLVISSPEYNFSIPGTLKNLIDWVSRQQPMPWMNQQILLLSASPSMVGGNRGLWATRVPLEGCGAFVYPQMYSLAVAHEAFDAAGDLKDAVIAARLKDTVQGFMAHVEKVRA
jgi:chromate reductase